jgi:hypothetical protein
VGWELLPTYGIGKLTQVPGRIGRWGRYALYWDTAQNAVQVGRGGYDIYENGLTWANGLQVGTGLLGLGGNYTTWRRLPGSAPAGATSRLVPGGGLAAHEAAGGHTIARHVGKSRDYLVQRLAENPKMEAASTFPDRATAERVIAEALEMQANEVQTWLAKPGKQLKLEVTMPYVTGQSLLRTGELIDVRGVRILLRRDPSLVTGYRIHTAYPIGPE